MKHSSLIVMLLVTAAVAVPCAAILVVPGPDYPVVAPFVWKHVVLIHVGAIAWLCWLIGQLVIAQLPQGVRKEAPAVGVVIGITLAIATVWVAPWTASRLEANQASFAVTAALRFAWTFGLVLPWMISAAAIRASKVTAPPHVALVVLALVIGIVLPVAYHSDFTTKHTHRLEELINQGRWRDAALLGNALSAMHSEQLVHLPELDQLMEIRQATEFLNRRVQELIDDASRPLPTDASPEQRTARAASLAGLGEYEIAAQLVSMDAETNLGSAMLLAVFLQDQKQFADSSRWYRHALRMAAQIKDPQDRRQRRRMCYDALAYNARELMQYRDAEAIYREAQRVEPADVPYFNLQLGKHYRLGGRPAMSIEHLKLAAEQDSTLAGEAENQRRLLAADTPGCFLGRPLGEPARR